MIIKTAPGHWWPQLILTYLLCLVKFSSSQEGVYTDNVTLETHTSHAAATTWNPATSNHSSVPEGMTQSSTTSSVTTDPTSGVYRDNVTLETHTSHAAATTWNTATSNHSSVPEGMTQSSTTSSVTTDPTSGVYRDNVTLETHTSHAAATTWNTATSNHSSVPEGMTQSSTTSSVTTDPTSGVYRDNVTLETHTSHAAATTWNTATSNHSSVPEGMTQSSTTSSVTTDPTSGVYRDNVTLETHTSHDATTWNPATSNHSSVSEGMTQSSTTSSVTTDPTSGVYRDNVTLETHTSHDATTWNPATSNHSSVSEGMTQSSTTSSVTTDPTSGDLICLLDENCPPYSSCRTQRSGIFSCQCDVGFYFHKFLGCIVARTFPARVSLSAIRWNPSWSEEMMLQEDKMWILTSAHVRTLFQAALRSVDGYLSTSIHHLDLPGGQAVLLHYFSTLYPVSVQVLHDALTHSLFPCVDLGPSCVLSADSYEGLSLCDFELCDPLTSSPVCQDGLLSCLCRDGYYMYHPWDRSCTACESGFQWKDGGCLRCQFGYGGFNCSEPFLLTMVVETCVLAVLVTSFIVLLFYYIRRKKRSKPTLMESIALRFPADQPVIRLPRPQFSLRSTWDWSGPDTQPGPNTQPGKESIAEPPEIQMRTFGESPRSLVSSLSHGNHNLAFVSDN